MHVYIDPWEELHQYLKGGVEDGVSLTIALDRPASGDSELYLAVSEKPYGTIEHLRDERHTEFNTSLYSVGRVTRDVIDAEPIRLSDLWDDFPLRFYLNEDAQRRVEVAAMDGSPLTLPYVFTGRMYGGFIIPTDVVKSVLETHLILQVWGYLSVLEHSIYNSRRVSSKGLNRPAITRLSGLPPELIRVHHKPAIDAFRDLTDVLKQRGVLAQDKRTSERFGFEWSEDDK